MIFLDLPEDIVHEVLLRLSDISSVISISETNKYLHHLAFTPTVWRALVNDLWRRNLLDRLSIAHIRTMSTERLVAVVKRLVVGPQAWSPPRIESPPQSSSILHNVPISSPPSARIVLHPVFPPAFPSARRTHFKILRGGKYALFRYGRDGPVLGCWRVADNSLVGTYHSALPNPRISDFEAEVIPGGERANIVMSVRAGTHNAGFIEIISWDFATGETELLSTTTCDYQLPSSPKICCGLAAVRVYQQLPRAEMYVIIDWHANKHCKLICPAAIGIQVEFLMELIPGYFILTTRLSSPNTTTATEIRVGAITSLAGSWVPVGQHTLVEPMLFSNFPLITSNTITLTGARIRAGLLMAIHESPLQHGTYRVWVSSPYSVPGGGDTAMLCSFRLSTSETGGSDFTWKQRSSLLGAPNAFPDSISYSGHTQTGIWVERTGIPRLCPPDILSAPIVLVMDIGTLLDVGN
ncbi:hypothetical protein C8R44DRAFT_849408 [Mycena epipterygia]|nr:hypothetical protein C8R44DRAFT_849408 [Mycena epipterygia]